MSECKTKIERKKEKRVITHIERYTNCRKCKDKTLDKNMKRVKDSETTRSNVTKDLEEIHTWFTSKRTRNVTSMIK